MTRGFLIKDHYVINFHAQTCMLYIRNNFRILNKLAEIVTE
jgi:hypothetical protein